MRKCLIPPTCHPRRKTYANKLCKPCYDKRRKSTKKPTCHPNRKYQSNNLCSSCWWKKVKKNKKYYKAHLAYHTAWIKAHPEQVKQGYRRRTYGLSQDTYLSLKRKQKGKCVVFCVMTAIVA